MNVSRIFVTTAAAISVLAAIGCSSTQTAPEVATAPMVVPAAPPEPVVAADTMPSPPALDSQRNAEAAMSNDAPVVMAQAPAMTPPAAPADIVERAPKADRN